jgi:dephospho-CoA kinase
MFRLKPNFQTLAPKARLYQLEVPLIGLTGGIATGKSSVAALLKRHGLQLISADELIKQAYKEESVTDYLRQSVPHILETEEIDFKTLRAEFFNQPALKDTLTKLLYKQLPVLFDRELKNLQGPVDVLIYDVPLLFENGLEALFDHIVLVYATAEQQKQRTMQRDGSSIELVEKILAEQWSIEDKKKKAHSIIDNSHGPEKLESVVQQWFNAHLEVVSHDTSS